MTELRQQLSDLYTRSAIERVYAALKFSILPFEQVAQYLPPEGRILEVGCGYGYVSNYLSLENPRRQVVGNDTAVDRVEVAKRTIGSRANIEFIAGDCREMPDEGFDGVVITDVLHHVPYDQQEPILRDVYRKLKPGGVLVMRETDIKFRLRYFLFNYLLELLLYYGVEKANFRKAEAWRQMLRRVGFTVQQSIPNPRFFPYITVLFVCAKQPAAMPDPGRPAAAEAHA